MKILKSGTLKMNRQEEQLTENKFLKLLNIKFLDSFKNQPKIFPIFWSIIEILQQSQKLKQFISVDQKFITFEVKVKDLLSRLGWSNQTKTRSRLFDLLKELQEIDYSEQFGSTKLVSSLELFQDKNVYKMKVVFSVDCYSVLFSNIIYPEDILRILYKKMHQKIPKLSDTFYFRLYCLFLKLNSTIFEEIELPLLTKPKIQMQEFLYCLEILKEIEYITHFSVFENKVIVDSTEIYFQKFFKKNQKKEKPNTKTETFFSLLTTKEVKEVKEVKEEENSVLTKGEQILDGGKNVSISEISLNKAWEILGLPGEVKDSFESIYVRSAIWNCSEDYQKIINTQRNLLALDTKLKFLEEELIHFSLSKQDEMKERIKEIKSFRKESEKKRVEIILKEIKRNQESLTQVPFFQLFHASLLVEEESFQTFLEGCTKDITFLSTEEQEKEKENARQRIGEIHKKITKGIPLRKKSRYGTVAKTDYQRLYDHDYWDQFFKHLLERETVSYVEEDDAAKYLEENSNAKAEKHILQFKEELEQFLKDQKEKNASEEKEIS